MGVRLACTAVCTRRECDWSSAGKPDLVEKAANRHSRATGHVYDMSCVPADVVVDAVVDAAVPSPDVREKA